MTDKPSQEFSFDDYLYFPTDTLSTFRFPHSPLTDHPVPLYGNNQYERTSKRKFFNDFDYYAFKMPCLKPDGMFKMEILKPDPGMRHTMLIK